MSKKIIQTAHAPAAIGPYSQGVIAPAGAALAFLSGQLGLDPSTGDFAGASAQEQARQAFKNLKNLVEETGATLNDVIKVNLFLTDLADFAAVNDVMKEVFVEPYPARSTVEVSGLPKGGLFEVEAIVAVK